VDQLLALKNKENEVGKIYLCEHAAMAQGSPTRSGCPATKLRRVSRRAQGKVG
jgi:hypothetical protein